MPTPAYHTQVALDAARCLLLAVIVTSIGWKIGGGLPRVLDPKRWALVAAPLCTPALLVSYTYASWALRLTGSPWLLNVFYSVLVGLKLIPLAVIARRMFPPVISREARFCEALIKDRSWTARLAFRRAAWGAAPWFTGGLVFLLAFTDFELASLLSVKTWAILLFDAHAGGLALPESLSRVIGPIALELLIIALFMRPVGRMVFRTHAASEPMVERRWALPALGAISAVMSFWPLVKIVGQSVTGWELISIRDVVGEEILMSLATALVATLAIWVALLFITRKITRLFLVLPGLLGALVLSLILLAALHAAPPPFLPASVQGQWAKRLQVIAESPLPLLVAEALLLAPVALILRTLLASRHLGEKLHLARMAGSRRLIWDLALEPRAAALGLLFLLGYFEFTAASILAPVQLTPVCVRLHNLAHYGQTAGLSALLVSAMLAPAAVLALTLGGARFYARKDVR